jgi:hypothetical protein
VSLAVRHGRSCGSIVMNPPSERADQFDDRHFAAVLPNWCKNPITFVTRR